MAELLVLMRHGKAERNSDSGLDYDRNLTTAGKRALKASLPYSLRLFLDKARSVAICSSPAARARQTAELVFTACAAEQNNINPELRYFDSLWDQDIDAFLSDVSSCSDDVLIAVGHNPSIEACVKELTESRIVMATGAFAVIELSKREQVLGKHAVSKQLTSQENTAQQAADALVSHEQLTDEASFDFSATQASDMSEPAASSYSGRLLWFVQGPKSQDWKTLVSLEDTLEEAAQSVVSRYNKFFEDPDDIETMHKFRVSIRTLRSLIAFVAPWQNSAQNKAIQKELKALVGPTSRLRELDVLYETAKEMSQPSEELINFCLELAQKERARVMNTLSSKQTFKRLERIVDQSSSIRWRSAVEKSGLSAQTIRAHFDELASALEAELIVLDISDVEKTHDVRKEAKRIRYDAENFKSIIGNDTIDIAKNMTSHQDNLGAICDARVNIDILNTLAASSIPETVVWDLSLLRAQNETYLYTTLRNHESKTPCTEPDISSADSSVLEDLESGADTSAPTSSQSDMGTTGSMVLEALESGADTSETAPIESDLSSDD